MNQKLSENILNEIAEFNVEEEISIEDIEQMEELLKNEIIIEPSNKLYENIVETLNLKYEKEKMNSGKNIKKIESIPIKELLIYIKSQITLLDKNFWITSIIFMVLGIIFVIKDKLYLVNILSPIIILFSVYYMYRGFYNNVYEMEVVCKYSAYEVTLGRSIIIICYNILFSSLIAIAYFIINYENLFMYIIVSWLAPLLLTYYISLYFLLKKGVIYSLVSNIFAWLSYIILFCKVSGGSGLDSINYNNLSWIYINEGLIAIALILILILLKQMKNNHTSNAK